MQDWQLIRHYVDDRSESAFTELVDRHIKLVYNTCLRDLRHPQMAEDATQVVFLVLSAKAAGLNKNISLPGWLFRTARFAAKAALRQDGRNKWREQRAGEAMLQNAACNEQAWSQIDGMLNDALASLSANDREAVLLRYFEELSFKEIGSVLDMTEDTANRRTARAVDKLRKYFTARNATVTVASLGALLTAHAAEAAPMGSWLPLSQSISVNAASGLAVNLAGMNLPELTQGVIHQMFIAKLKAAAIIGVVVLGGVGIVPLAAHVHAAHQATVDASESQRSAPVILGPAEEKLLAQLAKYPAEIKSLSAHNQRHYIHRAVYVYHFRRADGTEVLTRAEQPDQEGDWAFSGNKLYDSEVFGFGADGSPRGTRFYRNRLMFDITESPKTKDQPASRQVDLVKAGGLRNIMQKVQGPLQYGYYYDGDWLVSFLRKTGFGVVGSEIDPKYGPFVNVMYQVPGGVDPTTVHLWLAENHGLVCVKRDELSLSARFHCHWEATNVEKIGKFWMLPGDTFLTEYNDGTGMKIRQHYSEQFTDIHINDVPDSTFEHHLPAGTVVWIDDLPSGKKLPFVLDAAENLTPTNNPFP